MKGIILAGGTGSRLWPTTLAVSKQLLPVYDKPLIYYPLATFMLSGIRDILVITTKHDEAQFKELLGDGSALGIALKFETQDKPEGLAQAFTIAEEFIGTDKVALILGDNIFHGPGLGTRLSDLADLDGAHIFGYQVKDPSRYGVAQFDLDGHLVSIEEKPKSPKSSYAVPGLYFFDNTVVEKSKSVVRSERGEFEITSILNAYLSEGSIEITLLPRGAAWMDCGTADSLNDASNYVRAIEERQGLKHAVLEEIAFLNNWIGSSEIIAAANNYGDSEYGTYLRNLLNRI
jgi:glucose-1-phosphate thymidylyltransferase